MKKIFQQFASLGGKASAEQFQKAFCYADLKSAKTVLHAAFRSGDIFVCEWQAVDGRMPERIYTTDASIAISSEPPTLVNLLKAHGPKTIQELFMISGCKDAASVRSMVSLAKKRGQVYLARWQSTTFGYRAVYAYRDAQQDDRPKPMRKTSAQCAKVYYQKNRDRILVATRSRLKRKKMFSLNGALERMTFDLLTSDQKRMAA
jgi:hypothetical protein